MVVVVWAATGVSSLTRASLPPPSLSTLASQTTIELDVLKIGLAECDTEGSTDAVSNAVAMGLNGIKGKSEKGGKAGEKADEGEVRYDLPIGSFTAG